MSCYIGCNNDNTQWYMTSNVKTSIVSECCCYYSTLNIPLQNGVKSGEFICSIKSMLAFTIYVLVQMYTSYLI